MFVEIDLLLWFFSYFVYVIQLKRTSEVFCALPNFSTGNLDHSPQVLQLTIWWFLLFWHFFHLIFVIHPWLISIWTFQPLSEICFYMYPLKSHHFTFSTSFIPQIQLSFLKFKTFIHSLFLFRTLKKIHYCNHVIYPRSEFKIFSLKN